LKSVVRRQEATRHLEERHGPLLGKTKGSGIDSGGDIAERTDAVDRAGVPAFRGSMSTQLARQLILGVRREGPAAEGLIGNGSQN